MKNVVLIGGKRRSGKDHIGSIFTKQFGFKRYSFATALKEYIYEVLKLDFDTGENMKNRNDSVTMSFTDFSNDVDFMIRTLNYRLNKDKKFLYIEDIYNEYNAKYENCAKAEGFVFCLLKDMQALTEFDIIEKDLILEINVRLALQWLASYMKKLFGKDVWAIIGLQDVLNSDTDNIVITDFRFPYEDFSEMDALGNLNTISIQVLGKNRYEYDQLIDSHESETSLNDYKFDYIINNTVYGEPTILTVQIKAILNEKGLTWRI